MQVVLDLARRVAAVESTVLVTGESGVGKERVARLVHDESARAGGPFVAINCGAIAETLLESELFGHARGSFTGASQDRVGLFEAANRGTLFLDEVGELPAGMQVKLLRALQERTVRRVGESRARPIDVRIVAATNRELGEERRATRWQPPAREALGLLAEGGVWRWLPRPGLLRPPRRGGRAGRHSA